MIVHPIAAGDAIVEVDLLGRTVELWIVVATTLTHEGVRVDKVRRAGSRKAEAPAFTLWRLPSASRRYEVGT